MSSNTIYNTSPYFYIIEHISSGKKYAGCRYAKGCHKSELLQENGYKTSSGTILRLLDKFGLRDFRIIEIIQQEEILIPFGWNNILDFETCFLESNNCAEDDLWINSHNNKLLLSHDSRVMRKRNLEKYGVEWPMKLPEINKKSLNSRNKTFNEKIENSVFIPKIKELPRWCYGKGILKENWMWLPESKLEIIYNTLLNKFQSRPELHNKTHSEIVLINQTLAMNKNKELRLKNRNIIRKELDQRPIVLEILKFPFWFCLSKLGKNWYWKDEESLKQIHSDLEDSWNANLNQNQILQKLYQRDKVQEIIKFSKSINSRIKITSDKDSWWTKSEEFLQEKLDKLKLRAQLS